MIKCFVFCQTKRKWLNFVGTCQKGIRLNLVGSWDVVSIKILLHVVMNLFLVFFYHLLLHLPIMRNDLLSASWTTNERTYLLFLSLHFSRSSFLRFPSILCQNQFYYLRLLSTPFFQFLNSQTSRPILNFFFYHSQNSKAP